MNLARLKIESLYEKKFKIFFSVYHTISRLHPSRQRELCLAYPDKCGIQRETKKPQLFAVKKLGILSKVRQ